VLGIVDVACRHGFVEEAEQRLELHLYDRGGVSGTVLEPRVDAVRERITDALTAQSALPFGQVLSPREMTVLAELSTHLQGREIAERLYVSTNTLKTHTKAIYRKLGTTSRSESVAVAKSLGLIP
jgi:LuxR family maltose regulon positive regulatory protein